MSTQVVVYSRPGCHLCEDAMTLLAEFGLHATEVNIDNDPALRERYNEHVPVIAIDGKERFRGRIEPVLLRRLLEAASRSDLKPVTQPDASA